MTRVEEWTNAETGVGAAIAAGSQAENGIWALLVIAASVITAAPIWAELKGVSRACRKKFHVPSERVRAIRIKIATSPTRLVRAVTIPALYDFVLK